MLKRIHVTGKKLNELKIYFNLKIHRICQSIEFIYFSVSMLNEINFISCQFRLLAGKYHTNDCEFLFVIYFDLTLYKSQV